MSFLFFIYLHAHRPKKTCEILERLISVLRMIANCHAVLFKKNNWKKVMNLSFNAEDASQVAIGAFALAVPISFSEEAWKLGEVLPLSNLLLVFILSVLFLSFFAYQNVFQGNIKYRIPVFLIRIIIAYIIAALVVSLVLLALNKFPLFSEPETALKRLIVITMPASMGAIIVDSFDKE